MRLQSPGCWSEKPEQATATARASPGALLHESIRRQLSLPILRQPAKDELLASVAAWQRSAAEHRRGCV